MLRWILYSHSNEQLGEYQTLKEAFAAGNMHRLDTGEQYFIEDRLHDPELCWKDVE